MLGQRSDLGLLCTKISQCTNFAVNTRRLENSLEQLVFPGAADLGGEPLCQLVQAARVFQLNLRFAAEELLQVLQQLDTRLGLLLQAFELFDQLVADLCPLEEHTKMVRVKCLYC